MRHRLAALCFASLALPALASAQIPSGGEVRVNTSTTGEQSAPEVAMAADGRSMVVWQSEHAASGLGVFGQRYDAAGAAQGPELFLSDETGRQTLQPDVAVDDQNEYVAVWLSRTSSADVAPEVRGRRFRFNGLALGPSFRVDTLGGLNSDPSVARNGDGEFVVSWVRNFPQGVAEVRARRFSADGAPLGGEIRVDSTAPFPRSPQVTTLPDGGFFVVWHATQGANGNDILAQRFDANGVKVGGETTLNTTTALSQNDPAVAVLPSAGFMVVWESTAAPGPDSEIRARRFNDGGAGIENDFVVASGGSTYNSKPKVAADGRGDLLVVWEREVAGSDLNLFARPYASAGPALAPEFALTTTTEGAQSQPAVGLDAGGDAVVAWTSRTPTQDGSQSGVYSRRFTQPCVDGPTVLCLQNGRFKVEAAFRTSQGINGLAQARPLTPDTGTFYFFNEANIEMVVKVLRACGLNQRYWVFAGGLTDVEVDLSVTDTLTGAAKLYRNSAGVPFQPLQDTNAFATCDAGIAERVREIRAGLETRDEGRGTPFEEPLLEGGTRGTCTPSATRLCLRNDRFAVETEWTTSTGAMGAGTAVQLTPDTGYFTFFNASNVEMIVKVLNGCPLGNRYWVFAGGLTDVRVVTTVTDTSTGAQRTYTNPQGSPFQPLQDTGAFETCP